MSQADDPYVYPGTSVFRNKLNIHDAGRLGRAEDDLAGVRYAALLADIDSYNADERLALDGDTRPYIAAPPLILLIVCRTSARALQNVSGRNGDVETAISPTVVFRADLNIMGCVHAARTVVSRMS